jgi:hypothetical protein
MTRAGGVMTTLRRHLVAGLATVSEGQFAIGPSVPVQRGGRGRRCSSGAGAEFPQAGDKAVDNWGEMRGAVDNAPGRPSSPRGVI